MDKLVKILIKVVCGIAITLLLINTVPDIIDSHTDSQLQKLQQLNENM